jgi:chromosomal replication initiation ATPase DnaA
MIVDPPAHFVLDEIARRYGVTKEDLRSPSRKFILCHARWEAMRVMRSRGLTYAAIGRIVNRTQAVVAYGLKAHSA